MNITAGLIVHILTQAQEIECKNLRTESDCQEDIIIRFEDNTDTTVSIYYTPITDLIAIGTLNNQGDYRNHSRYGNISRLDTNTFRRYLTHEVEGLELDHEIENMIGEEEV